jgi:hypothetical protein
MSQITLRNEPRTHHLSGYGRINRALARYADGVDVLDMPIHLFCSPPYSFGTKIPGAFNVGLTMCDYPVRDYGFPFVDQANEMDLLLVPSDRDRQMFIEGGIHVPIEVVSMGHEHDFWYREPLVLDKRRVFMFNRGRDIMTAKSLVTDNGLELDYFTGPGLGVVPDEEMRDKHHHLADVFLKWAVELAWSYPTLEAMSAGCLIITNCPYVFLNDTNCFKFGADGSGLNTILRRIRSNDFMEKRLAGQKTAASLRWDSAASGILAACRDGYTRAKGLADAPSVS